MLHLNIWIILALSTHLVTSLKDAQKCSLDRVHGMITYNCANLKLKSIPKYLKTSTEVRTESYKMLEVGLRLFPF